MLKDHCKSDDAIRNKAETSKKPVYIASEYGDLKEVIVGET